VLKEHSQMRMKPGGWSLDRAAKENREDIACALIDRGADIEAKDEDGRTPLHYAVGKNSLDVTRLLIDRGADIEAKDNTGQTPLHIAFGGADIMLNFRLLGGTPLQRASGNNALDVARLLIDRGADIAAKDKDGRTPLHHSSYYQPKEFLARCNSLRETHLLIDRGADIAAKDKFGRTPLHIAGLTNSLDSALLLIDRGADIEAKDNAGQTPLHRAAGNNAVDTAFLLIDRGADIEAKDEDGRTPLQNSLKSDVAYVVKDHIAAVRSERVDPWSNAPISTLDYKIKRWIQPYAKQPSSE
jgi:ankyrin repeat protein